MLRFSRSIDARTDENLCKCAAFFFVHFGVSSIDSQRPQTKEQAAATQWDQICFEDGLKKRPDGYTYDWVLPRKLPQSYKGCEFKPNMQLF